MNRFSLAEIKHYYDRNTAAFLAHGQGGQLGAIHRAVWGPGVADRAQAFRYVEECIAALIRDLPARTEPLHVLDLGCGVGSSLRYLANELPIRGTGVTLSSVQARLAEQSNRAAGLSDRIACVEADFCEVPASVPAADLAFAIEAFVHVQEPARFFAECARLLHAGGLLVICDDFRRPADKSARVLEDFHHGWRVNSLLTAAELQALAGGAGFAHRFTVDLTPYLELARPRDRALSLLLPALRLLRHRSTRAASLAGGAALNECLLRRAVGYDMAVFERVVHASAGAPVARDRVASVS